MLAAFLASSLAGADDGPDDPRFASVVLTGAAGTLAWTVEPRGAEVAISGRSPKWTVSHIATRDLQPKRTTRTAAGVTVDVVYDTDGALLSGPSGEVRVNRAGLWDGDTLDLRLGYELAMGRMPPTFSAIDTSSAKTYDFTTEVVGRELCGLATCTHVSVRLAGVLRYLGPSWDYWYDASGTLLRFSGPLGDFAVKP